MTLADPRLAHARFGPWNPGLESTIPEELRPLTTLLRPENVFTTVAEARELRGFTGLDYADLVAFRPERLLLHELLIRVSADLSVPEGERIEDLGINFREMTRRLLAHMAPRLPEVEAIYQARRAEVRAFVAGELAALRPASAADTVRRWSAQAQQPGAPLSQAGWSALARVVSAVLVRHGGLWGPPEIAGSIATGLACNAWAGEAIGQAMAPWFLEAVEAHGYRLLPAQEHPVVMNTKGPSASGKTSIRFLQRSLAGRVATGWDDFARVSPDIWRKQLLDYASLGEAHKYAGALTGEELRIVDQKLDAYIARKAERGRMTHLLIDRFRFDSFAPHSDEPGSNLLTRFGHLVYLFFMVTPPASLVERAWNRGLEVGRYKAVDDTLAHAVEAYSGMPQLFFTWVGRLDKRVHFEFLDNEVPAGAKPLTAAFGWNETLTVLDARLLIDIERFRHIDVDARSPQELFPDAAVLAPARNAAFLRECMRRFRKVDFAQRDTGRVFLRLTAGRPDWVDRDALARALPLADAQAALAAAVPAIGAELAAPQAPVFLGEAERVHTVGQWGPW